MDIILSVVVVILAVLINVALGYFAFRSPSAVRAQRREEKALRQKVRERNYAKMDAQVAIIDKRRALNALVTKWDEDFFTVLQGAMPEIRCRCQRISGIEVCSPRCAIHGRPPEDIGDLDAIQHWEERQMERDEEDARRFNPFSGVGGITAHEIITDHVLCEPEPRRYKGRPLYEEAIIGGDEVALKMFEPKRRNHGA